MSEKAEKKETSPAKKDAKSAAAAPAAPAEKPAKGGMGKLPMMLGVVMVLEAVVLFAGFKFLGAGAKNANAADLTIDTSKPVAPVSGDKADGSAGTDGVELELLDSRFPNKRSGRTFLYDVDIYVSVTAANQDKVKKMITDRDALIKDRVRTIIAESDPDKLGGGSEPGLETLRRQVKYQLDEIIGDGMIEEVLIPRCIPFRTDY